MEQNSWLTLDEVYHVARQAAEACGASTENAAALAASIVAAEGEGIRNVGLGHLPDYCEGMLAGRINGKAAATFEQPTPVMFRLNAHSGLVHPAFDQHYAAFMTAAKTYGIAAFSVSHAFTCGVVGYFVRRLADDGLIAMAASNAGPAKVTVPGGSKPVFGTNPMAFAVPDRAGAAMVIDQSSSATAFVNVRAAHEAGEQLPQGWAVDAEGNPTQDPAAALSGALLAFGGYKGTNVALMVEMLSAGLTGSNWSCDAPAFNAGNEPLDIGFFLIAINPDMVCDNGFADRVDEYLKRYQHEFGGRIPGAGRLQQQPEGVEVPTALLERIRAYSDR